MEKELVILIEKRRKPIKKFLELISEKRIITLKELRKEFPDTTAHHAINMFIYQLNISVTSFYPGIEPFSLDLVEISGKPLKAYRFRTGIRVEETDHHFVLVLM